MTPSNAQLTDASHYLYAEYREGRFPMAETVDAPLMIVTPHERAVLPIKTLHIPKSLLKTVRQVRFEVRIDTAFAAVIKACAEARPGRPDTWISPDIQLVFQEFYRQGKAHSVECWKDGELVGGLYGLEVGGVFCGESMFSRKTDASKVALVHLCARLDRAGFTVLDAQFHNPHLEQFGLEVMPQERYVDKLYALRDNIADFSLKGIDISEQEMVSHYLNQRYLR